MLGAEQTCWEMKVKDRARIVGLLFFFFSFLASFLFLFSSLVWSPQLFLSPSTVVSFLLLLFVFVLVFVVLFCFSFFLAVKYICATI